ncbi:MAG TPA: putative Ig domain-containing protein, partial [Hyphomicrobiaceae bacterium]|nr:putative Ig domain-containing protein [Hyphomicrobiaceae bacterium]
GQRVEIALTGVAAEQFAVGLDGGEVDIDNDGVFIVTVPEGEREAAFSLWAAEDIDGGGALRLRPTLIDEAGEETHSGTQEAELALRTVDETPPAGGMELHGDWGLKLYPVYYYNEDGTPMLDVSGNPVPVLDPYGEPLMETRVDTRYPHEYNLERDINGDPDFGEQLHPLVGMDGAADHIWLGEFGEAGRAFGLGGDDYLEGMANVPNAIFGDGGRGLLPSGSGNDTIEGGESLAPYSDPGFTREGEHIEGIGDDIIYGGPGDDQLYADRISLLHEVLDVNTEPLQQKGDWINGETGDDLIYGSAASDALFGGGGADVIRAGAGDDVLDGDDSYHNWGDAWWEIDAGPYGVTFFPVTGLASPDIPFEYYRDFGGDDILDGGTGNDFLLGMLGDDALIGGAGDDQLEGWEGDDSLFGGEGDDILAGDFGRDERLSRRSPGSQLYVMPGATGLFPPSGGTVQQQGNDYLDGGAGDDSLLGEAGDDTLFGGSGADTLLGDADYLEAALHGADLLDGGSGQDYLEGFGGDDRLSGGADDDVIHGGDGGDVAEGGAGGDEIYGGEGDDVLDGGEGTDFVAGEHGADALYGGKGDDLLDGGDGEDTLSGEDGADQLAGGGGNDRLNGGAGNDTLSGGEGDDIVDGGTGVDTLQGGAGDDTYVLWRGYGSDRIDDSEGSSRIKFGLGIAPDDLKAALDPLSLEATISFGFVNDSVTFGLTEARFSGADFSDGSSWTGEQLLRLVPALPTQGSGAADVLTANPALRNHMYGLEGDDWIAGGGNDDRLAGGDGADVLDGGDGSDEYEFAAGEAGVDSLSDSGITARRYLDWYYAGQGISDWAERGPFGGKYKAILEGDGEQFIRYFDSLEQAYAEMPEAAISYIEPLESFAPTVGRDDAAALAELEAAGVLSRDAVHFGADVRLADLTITLTVDPIDPAGDPERPWHAGGLLSVRWGDAGFDTEVPDLNYGFRGQNLLTDGSDPETDVAGAWRGYRLGEGIEEFRFADGGRLSMQEVLERAVIVERAEDYFFARGSGSQTISRSHPQVIFDSDIRAEEVLISRDGTDLLIALTDGTAQGRIAGWYGDPAALPMTALVFAFDAEIDAATLTQIGLQVEGGEADDTLVGLDAFDDIMRGGAGNDALDGGGGKDTYVFSRGDGTDTIADSPSGYEDASIIQFADIFSWEATFGLGSLIVALGDGDAIRFTAFDRHDPYSTRVFDRLEFADGISITYEEVLARRFRLFGGDEDDWLIGTGLDDAIDGGARNDLLEGLGGADFIEGGDGDDTLVGGAGDFDFMSGSGGSDTYVYAIGDGNDALLDWSETGGEVDSVRLEGIYAGMVKVTQDPWTYYLVLGGGDVLALDSMPIDSAAVIELIEFSDGQTWTPPDLAARVQLLPPTSADDVLWGASDGEVILGLEGSDSLYGNGGDDLLVGGEGEDFYYFDRGHGRDVVDGGDADGLADSLHFGYAASTDVVLRRSGDDLLLSIGSDSVALAAWYLHTGTSSYTLSFDGDGVVWDDDKLLELAPSRTNEPPEQANPIADQTAAEDFDFSFSLPADTFQDEEGSETLTYTAALADGGPLPDWLHFDPATRVFAGVPSQEDVGSIAIRIT